MRERATFLRSDVIVRALAIVALFTVLGPPIGGVVTALIMAPFVAAKEGVGQVIGDLPKAMLVSSVFSYWIGLIPAALCGVAYALAPVRRYVLSACLGLCAAGIVSLFFFWPPDSAVWGKVALVAAVGAVSAVACDALVRGAGALWRRVKPAPTARLA